MKTQKNVRLSQGLRGAAAIAMEKNRMMIQSQQWCDLHCHTTCSDGSDTPEQLVVLAKEAGLAAVAVTDHDTVDGLERAESAAQAAGIEMVPGVELSVLHPHGNMHLLGYYVDPGCADFKRVIAKVQDARSARNPKIVEKLRGLGMDVSMEELEEMAGGGQIGRPHIARALVAKGYVKSVYEAFDRYLKKDGPAYVPKSILSPADAIGAVTGCGGVAVLAHPFSLGHRTREELEGWIAEWKEMGLQGVECYYSEHDQDFTSFLLSLCRRLGLAATGGSDYHGRAKPHIALGRGRGNLKVPYSCVEAIKELRG